MAKNQNPIKDAKPRNTTGYVAIGEQNISGMSDGLQSFRGVFRNYHYSEGARTTYKDVETNISVRDQFRRQDYEYFRSSERIPTDREGIQQSCMNAYRHVGIVRNVIDLMADFGSQGARLIHENKTHEKFYQAWWKKIQGADRTERAFNLLYRCGVFVPRRIMAKISRSNEKKLRATARDRKLEADVDYPKDMEPQKRTIPIRYVFLNPLTLDVLGGELASFVGQQVYTMRVNQRLRRLISHPNADTLPLVKKLPKDMVKAIREGGRYIVLDPDKVSAYHYKKDDWQLWADPMIYAILDELMILNKMQLADLAALDTVISQIRIWRLGDLEKGIFPTDAAVDRLIEILTSNPGGGAFDVVWGPDLEVDQVDTKVHAFLGSKKYEPVMNGIYAGLGVPPTLTGTSNAAGFTNNYISLQTLIRRLEYGRSVIRSFWDNELKIVQKAMNHAKPAKLIFEHNILSDEAAMKKLLMDLADRDVISVRTLAERFSEDPDIEQLRIKKENELREAKKMSPKASPWHAPEKWHEYVKLAIPRGFLGLDVDNQVLLDTDTPFDRQLEQQIKALTLKGNPDKSSKTGEPSPGRPLNSKDSNKRDPKKPRPVGSAADIQQFMAMSFWAKEAQSRIARIANPLILEKFNKKNHRSLSEAEAKQSEKFKFALLMGLKPYSDVTAGILVDIINNSPNMQIETSAMNVYNKLVSDFYNNMHREPCVDELRSIQTITYSILNGIEE
jgi:hypothetical protein